MKTKMLLIGGVAAASLLVGGWAAAETTGHGPGGMTGGMHVHMGPGMRGQMRPGMVGQMGSGMMGMGMMGGDATADERGDLHDLFFNTRKSNAP